MTDQNWTEYVSFWPWRQFKLIDGSTLRGGIVFRRRTISGEWQYRRPTVDETDAAWLREAW